jgi:hypothetical protein
VAKVFESLVQKQLINYFYEHNFITPEQSAFLKNHSTQTSLHRVVDHWLEALDNCDIIGVTFFDIKKCFDSISHEVLINKLMKYGVISKELQWFKNYLCDRSQAVCIDNHTSNYRKVETGIPQGSNLGPLLFLIFINDFSVNIPDVEYNMYADDTAIYVTGKNGYEIKEKLQRATLYAMEWFGANKLAINESKSYTMLICNSCHPDKDFKLNIYANNSPLDQCDTIKYLGVTIDSRLSWSPHINELCKKLSQKVSALKRLSAFIPNALLLKVYISNIQSITDYCCTVWGNSAKCNLDRVMAYQKRAIRIVSGIHDYNISAIDLMKSLGLQTVYERVHYFTSLIMFKCISGQAPNYLCDHFTLQADLHSYETRNSSNGCLALPKPNKEIFKQSLLYNGPKIWNSLPNDLKNAMSKILFKRKYKMIYVF